MPKKKKSSPAWPMGIGAGVLAGATGAAIRAKRAAGPAAWKVADQINNAKDAATIATNASRGIPKSVTQQSLRGGQHFEENPVRLVKNQVMTGEMADFSKPGVIRRTGKVLVKSMRKLESWTEGARQNSLIMDYISSPAARRAGNAPAYLQAPGTKKPKRKA